MLDHPRTSRAIILMMGLSPLVSAGIYVAAYLLSTEVFRGRIDDSRLTIRLFQTELHQRIFLPLLEAEQLLRPTEPEFSGQVRSGASLPPLDEDGRSKGK